MTMTSYERVLNTLNLKPVDRIPFMIQPWDSTVQRWISQGHLTADDDVGEVFGQDIKTNRHWIKNVADIDFVEVVLEQTQDTVLKLDGNGATLRRKINGDTTPEHVDFTVKDRHGWLEHIKPHLTQVDKRRIPFDSFKADMEFARSRNRYFCWGGVGPFEQMHPVCGHEYMLMGMALDPDWVKDMVMTYSDFTIMHLTELFAETGYPDALFFFEDMGFKFKPFMSPAMYRDIVMPGHKRLFDFAHSINCKVIIHSCGFIEPLVPSMIEAGMDCLQAMEVKAGVDMPRLFEQYGRKISFFGGIDARVLIENDFAAINAELQKKIVPVIRGGGGYILHSDHSEPPQVDFETMRYFIRRGIEIADSARTQCEPFA